jgi:hypothetical protein
MPAKHLKITLKAGLPAGVPAFKTKSDASCGCFFLPFFPPVASLFAVYKKKERKNGKNYDKTGS